MISAEIELYAQRGPNEKVVVTCGESARASRQRRCSVEVIMGRREDFLSQAEEQHGPGGTAGSVAAGCPGGRTMTRGRREPTCTQLSETCWGVWAGGGGAPIGT